MILRSVLCICIGLICAQGAVAANDGGDRPRGMFLSLQLENDIWGSGDDRFYSHGTQINVLLPGASPAWLDNMANRLPFFQSGSRNAVQFTLGHKIFTPEDTDSTALIEDDRPYAGWVFVSAELLGLISQHRDRQVGNLFGFTIGLVGPGSHADHIQNDFHDLIGVERSNGWGHQLDNELGININYTQKWQYFHDLAWDTQVEVAPHVTAALGNIYTYAGIGLMTRWGNGLRNDFSPPNIRPGFPGIPYLQPGKEPRWYLFAGAEARAVARNIFLDGNTFSDSHSVDREPFVADLQFGIAYQLGPARVALSNVWRSREFDGQSENTQFGALNLSVYLQY